MRYLLVFVLSVAFMSSCTKVEPVNDSEVAAVIKSRIHHKVRWKQDGKVAEEIASAINFLLKKNLTEDTAVEIALLNNPEIQATFEALGIAQADLVAAGLFQNPILEGFVRFPNKNSAYVNSEFSVAQGFLDIFLIPLRKKVAETEFEQAKLKVSSAILDLSFDVRKTYFSFVAEKKKIQILKLLVETLEIAQELSHAQRRKGNINDLELQSRIKEYLQAKVELSKSRLDLIFLREKLNKLLGLKGWKIAAKLLFPQKNIPLQALEAIALSRRLDLQVARLEIERIRKVGATKKWWAYSDPYIGVSTEKDSDGTQITGPAFGLTLPLFNYGQADRTRLFAMYRQSKERLKNLEIQVQSEVRQAQRMLQVKRNLIQTYRNRLLPLQRQIIAMSKRFYSVMGLSVYKLLDSKKEELKLQIETQQELRDYWISRVDLDQALGGKLHLLLKKGELP